jgi:hypothetical protein
MVRLTQLVADLSLSLEELGASDDGCLAFAFDKESGTRLLPRGSSAGRFGEPAGGELIRG